MFMLFQQTKCNWSLLFKQLTNFAITIVGRDIRIYKNKLLTFLGAIDRAKKGQG